MSFNERYAKEEGKTFTPPKGVQSAARKALKWIEEGHAGSGFTGVGRGRAHQLANGEAVSLSTIKRMHSFFSRHRVDKQGKDWNKPSPGKVAWYAWGGDAGASWAAGIAESHDGKKKEASVQSQQVSPVAEHYLGTLDHDVVKQNTLGMGLNNAAVRHSDVRSAVAGQGQMGPSSLMASQAHQNAAQQHSSIANALSNIDSIPSAIHANAASLHLAAAKAHSLTSNMIKNNAPGHGPSDTGSSTSARGAEFATQLISNHNDAVSKSSSANAATVNANSSKIDYGTPPLPERIGSFDAKYATEKEASLADMAHNVVTHLPTVIPAVAAEAAAVTGLVKTIKKNRNKPAPPTGSDEAYNATGFMSPSQIQDYKNKDVVEKNSSFDERYANEKSWMESMGGEPAVKYPNLDEIERSFMETGESNGCKECGTRIGEVRKLDEAFNGQSVSSEELRRRGLDFRGANVSLDPSDWRNDYSDLDSDW